MSLFLTAYSTLSEVPHQLLVLHFNLRLAKLLHGKFRLNGLKIQRKGYSVHMLAIRFLEACQRHQHLL